MFNELKTEKGSEGLEKGETCQKRPLSFKTGVYLIFLLVFTRLVHPSHIISGFLEFWLRTKRVA